MKEISDQIKEEVLLLNEQNHRPTFIGKKLNISRYSVYNILKNKGIKILNNRFNFNKKYNINESFFECIDAPEKAYFLGWIYSDGCITDSGFYISIKRSDYLILQKLTGLISTDKIPLKITRRNNKDGFNREDLISLKIKRKKMLIDLKKLGLFKNKSSKIQFPSFDMIPNKFMMDFIRGYFDGDGGFYISKIYKKQTIPKFSCSMVCSKKFAIKLKLYLKSIDIKSFIIKKTNTNKVVSLYIGNYFDCLKFAHELYKKDTELKLYRKFEKFLKILESYSLTKSKINYKTISFFKEHNIFRKYLNLDINYDSHWTIDNRNY